HLRLRAHDRGGAHHHADLDGAALGRTRGHERGNAGFVLPRRRQFDLLRAEAAHHAEPRPRPGHAASRQARFAGDGVARRSQAMLRTMASPANRPTRPSATEPITYTAASINWSRS